MLVDPDVQKRRTLSTQPDGFLLCVLRQAPGFSIFDRKGKQPSFSQASENRIALRIGARIHLKPIGHMLSRELRKYLWMLGLPWAFEQLGISAKTCS
jgi:hypothetical protein